MHDPTAARPEPSVHPAGAHDSAPHVNYMYIFYALCGLTLLSVLADVLGKGQGKVLIGSIVLIVACCKAAFVMMYFMHLKFEAAWKYALLAPTIILAGFLMIALIPDIGLHYYANVVPQTMERETAPPVGTGLPVDNRQDTAGQGVNPAEPAHGPGSDETPQDNSQK